MDELLLLFNIPWASVVVGIVKLLMAYALAMPIAWNRERVKFTAGLRTFPLVAVGAAGYVMIAYTVFGDNIEAQARVFQGLLGGIGFIGGGAILKEGANVKGTATAAGIWVTGAIGAAVAYNQIAFGLILSVATLLTFKFLTPIKQATEKDEEMMKEE